MKRWVYSTFAVMLAAPMAMSCGNGNGTTGGGERDAGQAEEDEEAGVHATPASHGTAVPRAVR